MASWDSKGGNGILSWLKLSEKKTCERLPVVSKIRTLEVRQLLGLVLRRIRIKFLKSFRSTHCRVCRMIQVEIWIYFFGIGYILSIDSNAIDGFVD